MRKGVILLTEGRSGSNWLGSLARNAGLGNSGEWLDPSLLGTAFKDVGFDVFMDRVLSKASAEEAGFFLKVFPRHLFEVERYYGRDFLLECAARHETRFIVLTRRDRLRQAISFSIGLQTGQWTSRAPAGNEPVYDFDQICRCFFLIGRSYDFWASYVSARGLGAPTFVYEELVSDPAPFIACVAASMGKAAPAELVTDLKVQRNEMTEAWVARFTEDAKRRNFLAACTPARPARRTFSNLVRFLGGRQLKPMPYAY